MTATRIKTAALPQGLTKALAHVSDWDLPSPAQRAPTQVHLLTRSGVHQVYRSEVVTEQGIQRVVIRLPTDRAKQGKPASRMGLEFPTEVANQRRAAGQSLAPEIFWSDPNHQLIVMAYLERNPPFTETDLAQCLRGIHRLSLEGERLDLAQALERYRQVAGARGVSLVGLIDPNLTPLREAIGARAKEPAVGCHNDLNAANLLWGNGPMAIDWEYAAPGDPYFDLAAACVGNPQLDSDRVLEDVLGGDYQPDLWRIAKGVYRAVELNWGAAMGQETSPEAAKVVMAYLSEVLK
jgi:hypothetical protein